MSELLKAQFQFASDVALLIDYIFKHGYKCTLGETYRPTEMAKIYAKEGKGILASQHCQRLAIDINLFTKDGIYLTKNDDYEDFGIYWESLSPENKWGGRFSIGDGNHFQRKG